MPFYVLLGGSRNGQRISSDGELLDLRLQLSGRIVDGARPERYRPTREVRDGFIVARIVGALGPRTSTGWATS